MRKWNCPSKRWMTVLPILFEGEVKADTAEAETDEAEDETQQAVSEI